jgi:hypothetical protein
VLVVLGLLTVAGGLIFFATASVAPGYGHYLIAMVAMSAATSASMGRLPREMAGVGSALRR